MVTIIILAITVLVSFYAFSNREFLMKLMYVPYLVQERNEFYRAFSHQFIHADWMHLIFNMIVLYNFGPILETIFTIYDVGHPSVHFALLYFGAGLFATLLPFARHKNNPNYMALGASGAVSGILFAFICVQPSQGLTFVFFPFFDIPAYVVGILYLAYEYYMDKKGNTGIAHDAHIGGALFGIAFMFIFHFQHVINAISGLF